MSIIPESAEKRKEYPVASGLLDYFPDACAYVAYISYIGSKQHHPDKPLHWDRPKSSDHADCLMRHFIQRGEVDSDGIMHMGKAAWRALALLQLEIEGVIGVDSTSHANINLELINKAYNNE